MKLITFLLVLTTLRVHAFTLNNTAAASFEQDDVNVYFADNCANNTGVSTAEWLDMIQRAVDKYWNTVPTARLTLHEAGIKSVDSAFYNEELCTTSGSSCTVNPNLIVDSGILISCNAEATENFPNTGILGKAIPNNTSGDTIIGSLIVINDTVGSLFFVQLDKEQQINVIAHEIGHALGLGHSPFEDNLMYAENPDMRFNLGWDDVDGLSFLYPAEQPFGGFCATVEVASSDDQNKNGKNSLILILALLMSLSFIKRRALK